MNPRNMFLEIFSKSAWTLSGALKTIRMYCDKAIIEKSLADYNAKLEMMFTQEIQILVPLQQKIPLSQPFNSSVLKTIEVPESFNERLLLLQEVNNLTKRILDAIAVSQNK